MKGYIINSKFIPSQEIGMEEVPAYWVFTLAVCGLEQAKITTSIVLIEGKDDEKIKELINDNSYTYNIEFNII